MANQWDRLPKESPQAYAAFLVFRDLGPERTPLAAYRGQRAGKEGAKQVPGRWNGWVKDHRWRARVRAWDAYLATHAEKAVVKEVVSATKRWAKRQELYRATLWIPFRHAARHAWLAEKKASESGQPIPIETVNSLNALLTATKDNAKEACSPFPGAGAVAEDGPKRLSIPEVDVRTQVQETTE